MSAIRNVVPLILRRDLKRLFQETRHPAGGMEFLAPPDGPDVVYEFFSPFAHVPGKFEWCRIRSPTHGVFDVFIVLGTSTEVAATVYVNSSLGASFMAQRYPECTTFVVPPAGLKLDEAPDGRSVSGRLEAAQGPLRRVAMTISAPAGVLPRAAAYGGNGRPVWGSRFTCWGVDLVLAGVAKGQLETADGKKVVVQEPAVVTLGSFGRLAPLRGA